MELLLIQSVFIGAGANEDSRRPAVFDDLLDDGEAGNYGGWDGVNPSVSDPVLVEALAQDGKAASIDAGPLSEVLAAFSPDTLFTQMIPTVPMADDIESALVDAGVSAPTALAARGAFIAAPNVTLGMQASNDITKL